MPEKINATQAALLDRYTTTLQTNQAAPPPAALDPDLATVVQTLARHLGPRVAATATPDPAFRAALAARLTAQATASQQQAGAAPPPVILYPPQSPAPASSQSRPGNVTHQPARPPHSRQRTAQTPTVVQTPVPLPLPPSRRRRIMQGLSWAGGLSVLLILLLLATLIWRSISRTETAQQPTPLPALTVPTPGATPTSATPSTTPAPPTRPAPTTAGWQPTGNLTTPRTGHTAVRLADGRVLVTGGLAQNSTGVTNTAEIYDPRSGQWTATAPMGTAKAGHNALLLPDGRVLVVGGSKSYQSNESMTFAESELFNPATGAWQQTASPPVSLGVAALALLSTGEAIAVSRPLPGTSTNNPTRTILRYVLETNTWETIGRLNLAGVSAVHPLPNNRLLLLGQEQGYITSVIYDFTTGEQTTVPLPEKRNSVTTSQLPDGSVLIIGGNVTFTVSSQPGIPVGKIATTALRFDPQTKQWSVGTELTRPYLYPSIALLADGRVLLLETSLGVQNPAQPQLNGEIYDPKTGRSVPIQPMPAPLIRRYALTPLTDGRVLLSGGDTDDNTDVAARAETLLFTPPSITPEAAATPRSSATPLPVQAGWQATGSLAMPRADHTATLLNDGRVLVAGGYGAQSDSVELYDPRTGRWTAGESLLQPRIRHAAILLADGQVLVAGGFNNTVNNTTTSISGAERYNPLTGRWQRTSAPPIDLGLVMMDRLPDGQVLLLTLPPVGVRVSPPRLTELLYNPATDSWATVGTLPVGDLQLVIALTDGRALLLGGATAIWVLNPATGEQVAIPIPEAYDSFTAARLHDGTVLFFGSTRPANGPDSNPTQRNAIWRFDRTTLQWVAVPGLTFTRMNNTAGLLPDGRLLFADAGVYSGQNLSLELYDPRTGQSTTTGTALTTAHFNYTVTALADGRVLLVGGDAGIARSEYVATSLIFTPPPSSQGQR